ncbi:MAG TPA: hypothetical protein VFG76_03435 [Candidatus Polarisedimenticolia bacterium]|nr:hypothetical protein [Candidatus Polarisedimenticolia bacterium]
MRAHLSALALLALIVVLAVAVAILLHGEGIKRPVESLPGDTQLIVQAPDVPRLMRDLSRRVSRSGSPESGWNLLADIAEEALRASRVSLSPSSADLTRLLPGEAVLAFIPGGRSQAPEPVLVVEVGSGSDRAASLARGYTASLPEGLQGTWTSRSHRGREYAVWRSSHEDAPVCLTGLRGLLLVTTSGSLMRRMLDTLDGREDSLASDPVFKTVMRRLDHSGDFIAYAAADWLRPRIEGFLAAHPLRRRVNTADWLGSASVRGAGLEIRVAPSRFEDRLFVAMTPGDRGLLGDLFANEPATVRPSSHVPAELPFYLSLSVSDPGAVYHKLPGMLGGASCGGARDLRQRLDGLEQMLALDLEKDVFGALGGEFRIGFGAAGPVQQMSLNPAALMASAVADISVRDRGKIAEILRRTDGLARLVGALRVEHQDRDGITHYEIPALAPMRPAYRLAKDHLLLGTDPALLERPHASEGEIHSYANREEIAALLKKLPGRAHLFFCTETTRLIESLLGAPQEIAPSRGIPEILTEYLEQTEGDDLAAPSGMVLRMGASGLLVETVSPFSPSLLAYLAMNAVRPAD